MVIIQNYLKTGNMQKLDVTPLKYVYDIRGIIKSYIFLPWTIIIFLRVFNVLPYDINYIYVALFPVMCILAIIFILCIIMLIPYIIKFLYIALINWKK